MTSNEAPRHLPTAKRLIQISALLKDEPIPKVLSAQPEIPRTLLTAAKRGVREDSASQISATKAMVDSLLALSKTSILSKKRSHDTKKPSPFSKTRAAKLGNKEMETINRAGKWATTLLTDCIRATPTETNSKLSSISHTNTDTVFVAPRDTLDPVLAKRYANQATRCLDHPIFRDNLSVLAAVQAFLMSTATRSSHHTRLCLPVLDSALHAFASAPCPLYASEQSSRTLDRILEQSSSSLNVLSESLSKLSSKAKGTLFVQSLFFRNAFRQHVQQLYSSQRMMSYATERESINPLAQAAVIDLHYHWELMDHVRNLVSAFDAPFSLHLWNERRFFRAMFSEILQLIESDNDHETTHRNVVIRFPPFGRPIVRLLLTLSGSMQSHDIQAQRMAVSMATNFIWKVLNLGEDVIWTPNIHTVMICAEGLLELFCWATTFSLSLDEFECTRPIKRGKSRERDPLTCVCYLSTLLETSRLPGGELVETKTQLETTALSMRNFLVQVSRRCELDLVTASRENRISGLGAFALSGILCRKDLDISVRPCETVPSESDGHLHRSLEKSSLWTKDPNALSKLCNLNLAVKKSY